MMGGEDFTEIQDAINIAFPGDTIRVYEGIYRENVDVNKRLDLIGDGSTETIIDGGRSDSTVTITSNNVEMSGFMITGSDYNEGGIKVQSDNNRINNNFCWENYYGIYLDESEDNIISDNICSYNEDFPNNYGIYLDASDQNSLFDNICSYNDYGINLRNSNQNTLSNNNCSYNDITGIYLRVNGLDGSCEDNTLSDNICDSNREYGLHLAGSSQNSLKGNQLNENDILITGDNQASWNNHVIDTTNTVNGKPVRYYEDTSGMTVPSDAGQVILASCTEMIVENQGHDKKGTGILVGYSTGIIIRNNNCSNRYYGIILDTSDDNTIENNTCMYNFIGIHINGKYNTIRNNTCSHSIKGIYIWISNHNIIANNKCSNNLAGIAIYYNTNCTVENNDCSYNDIGIHVDYLNSICYLDNNTLNSNIEYGIYLESSEFITLTNNRLVANEIFLEGNKPLYWDTHSIDSTNTVNGKPVRYYKNSNNETVHSNAGQVILVFCADIVVENQGHDQKGISVLAGYSARITIRNNNCSYKYYGIYLYECIFFTIQENNCSNSYEGIYLRHSYNNSLRNNSFSNNGNFGISLYWSMFNTLSDNKLMQNMIYIWGNSPEYWNTQTIDTTNTVNGRPVRYYENSNDMTVPSGAGQVILGVCNEMVVENQGNEQDNVFLLIGYSTNILIKDNNFSNNNRWGMYIRNSYYCTIENNICANNSGAIHLYNSDDNNIKNNNCSNSGGGITLQSSSENIVRDNIISNNDGSGITLSIWSDQNTLTKNTCSNNGEDGIRITLSSENSISHNTISGNMRGIHFQSSCPDSIVYFNNIYNNIQKGISSFYGLSQHYTVDAVKNWWGDLSGPYNFVNNSKGNGDRVASNVLFDPWLRQKVSTPTKAYIDVISPNPASNIQQIHFEGHGTGDGDIIRYVWYSSIDSEFFNGTESDCSSESLSLGEHTIYFQVQDEQGNWSEEVTSSLTITEKPVVELVSISPNPALDTDDIQFVGRGTDDGTIERYAWRTDDIEFMNGSNSESFYGDFPAGTYTIFLMVQDNHGIWSDEVQDTLIVHERPHATIESISPEPALVTNNIDFIGSGMDDGTIERYVWRTDDMELHNDTFSDFSSPDIPLGTHNVYLKVQDNHDIWSKEVQQTLIVHQKPVATIESISPNPGLDIDIIKFIGSGTDDGTIDRYAWRTDDVELYNGTDFEFLYSGLAIGIHSVYYKVRDDHDAWSEEVIETLIIHQVPTASIDSITPAFPTTASIVHFSGSGIDDGMIMRYIWTSSLDGELYNGSNTEFEVNALSPATHIIYLKVQDDNGVWSEEVSTAFNVQEPIEIDGGSENDPEFPFNQIGPLPIIAYIIILCIVVSVIIGFAMRRKDSMDWDSDIQQPSSSPPTQQIYPIQSQQTQEQLPPESQYQNDFQWKCPQCGCGVGSQYTFCLDCGYKWQ